MHPSFELEAFDLARFKAEIASRSSTIIVHSVKPILYVDCTSIVPPAHSSSLLPIGSPLSVGFLPEAVGELSSRNAPWVYDLFDPSTSVSLSPTPFYFFMGNQPSQNLGMGVFGSLSCDTPHELVRDRLVISVGANYGSTISNFSNGLSWQNQLDWQMANRLTQMSSR